VGVSLRRQLSSVVHGRAVRAGAHGDRVESRQVPAAAGTVWAVERHTPPPPAHCPSARPALGRTPALQLDAASFDQPRHLGGFRNLSMRCEPQFSMPTAA